MSESGGSTTESGILYQNSIAALYLGRLVDGRSRADSERAEKVRCEAVNHVDDIVVTFADGHHLYIQAKENVRKNQDPWKKLFKDFDNQFRHSSFQRKTDVLTLCVGTIQPEHHNLRDLCERAQGSENYTEWWEKRLTPELRELVGAIKPLLHIEFQEQDILEFFGCIKVKIWPLEDIEQDISPNWMPHSNKETNTLFRLLRDRTGGHARIKRTFTSHDLIVSLRDQNSVELNVLPEIEDLRRAVKACGALLRQHKSTIAETQIHISRDIVSEIVDWACHNDERNVAALLDQAGMGKTVVMRDIQLALEERKVCVLAVKADLQLSGVNSLEYLQQRLYLPEPVHRIISRLATMAPVVVLIDQMDALSLSLARDQSGLTTLLDLVARLRLIPGVRILFACRVFDYANDPRIRNTNVGCKFDIPPFTEIEVSSVIARLGQNAEALSEAAFSLLKIPLHLDLFARVLATNPTISTGTLHGISSLQELYRLFWDEIVLKQVSNGPAKADREEVLRRVTARMNTDQRITVPQSILREPNLPNLQIASEWLASEGILIQASTEWGFLHQTFFDYCYARFFVDSGQVLTETIINSEQGLFSRPQLLQVLTYLRSTDSLRYIQELQNLLEAPALRVHLRDLLLRWIGNLAQPTQQEWIVVHRWLVNPGKRSRMLRAIQGNIGWFAVLRPSYLNNLLVSSDETLDHDVCPYLASLLEISQEEVLDSISKFLGQSDKWNRRIVWLLSRIIQWNENGKGIALYETSLQPRLPGLNRPLFELERVCIADSEAGCRIIGRVLEAVTDSIVSSADHARISVDNILALNTLTHGTFHDAIIILADKTPQLYVWTLLPWIERTLNIVQSCRKNVSEFIPDLFAYPFVTGETSLSKQILLCFISALAEIANMDYGEFCSVIIRFGASPFETPQRMIASAFRLTAEQYSTDALKFLLDDLRRLRLEAYGQHEISQLITAIYPHLSSEQRADLEQAILSLSRTRRNIIASERNQLRLLRTLPSENLTVKATRRLRKLESKYKAVANEDYLTDNGVFILQSSIPEDRAKSMSDAEWLKIVSEDNRNGMQGNNLLPRNTFDVSAALLERTKEEPERFFRLTIDQFPDNINEAFSTALIAGIGTSGSNSQWLFTLVRKFANSPEDNVRSCIAGYLKDCNDEVPQDLLDLLEGWLHSPMREEENNWKTNASQFNNEADEYGADNAYNAFLNTFRGQIFRALMVSLQTAKIDGGDERRWALIEYAVSDPSTALRTGAIESLLFLIDTYRTRTLDIFDKLMDGNPDLLITQPVYKFLRNAWHRNLTRLLPYVQALLNHEKRWCQREGAGLISLFFCQGSMTPQVFASEDEYDTVKNWISIVEKGQVTWRRGAARTYRANFVRDTSGAARAGLERLIDDVDVKVRETVGSVFELLDASHIGTHSEFIKRFVTSRSLGEGLYDCTRYLTTYGNIDPMWTLSILEFMLKNPHVTTEHREVGVAAHLVRLTLSIYNDPISNTDARRRTMDVFDVLIEHFPSESEQILMEWDTR